MDEITVERPSVGVFRSLSQAVGPVVLLTTLVTVLVFVRRPLIGSVDLCGPQTPPQGVG
jgi:hypothetical protein